MRIRRRRRVVYRRGNSRLAFAQDIVPDVPDIDPPENDPGRPFVFFDHHRPPRPIERRDAFARGSVLVLRVGLKAGAAAGTARASGGIIEMATSIAAGTASGQGRAYGSRLSMSKFKTNAGRATGAAYARGRVLRPHGVIEAEEEALLLAS